MTRKLLALAAGTLAVVLVSSTFDAADAKSRGASTAAVTPIGSGAPFAG